MKYPKKALVIAPHPDDETLGVGGSIARFIQNGTEVSVLIVSGHLPPLYDETSFVQTKEEAKSAFKTLGVKEFNFLEIPATMVNQVPVAELNGKIVEHFKNFDPDWVFLPFPDRHIDHRIILMLLW